MNATTELALTFCCALALVLAACDEQIPVNAGPAPEQPEAAAPSLDRYTVRGELVALPEPGGAVPQVSIRHEAIDGFIDDQGRVSGMNAMTMPFVLEDGVSVVDLPVGAKVEFEYVVDWPNYASWIADIRKLPDDTTLEFRQAQPRMQAPNGE